MEISLHRSLFAVISSLLLMGGEVQSDCTEDGIGIEGGHYTLSNKLQTGSMLVYHCPENYYPYPALVRICHHRWTPPPKRFQPQRCKLVECPDPNVLENGEALPPQERYFVGNETTYECYSGYTMRGSSRRVCLSNGKWSGHTTICSRDTSATCADPGVPPGASRTGNYFNFNDKVQYHCNSKLFLVGSKTRVCQESGHWTGKEPACYYTHTYDTPLEVSEAFGSAITNSLTTLESLDDTQEGRKIRISKNGTLNIYIAVDISESIKKDQVDKAKDAILKLISKISSFSVTPNYEIIFFASEAYEIVNILDFLNGGVDLSSVKKKLQEFNTDGRSHGTNLANVFKKFLEKMAIIKIRAGEAFLEHRHVILIFTDGGYNIGGSPVPTVARIKNMVYMNHTSQLENRNREEYLDIYVFAIGAQIIDDDLQPLTAGTGGQHYFRMKDITNLKATFDDIIDEEDVKGLCGLHKDDDDVDSNRKKYPWYAFIIVQNEGGPRKCIGSLVTPMFVLTAAHCFRFGDRPHHVTVEINDGQGTVKKVKDFREHPNYDISAKVKKGVKEFYDYDVALIQLEEAVRISSSARPICIPCTQETSDALQLVGASTCKQQEQLLLATHLEKLNFLTRGDTGVREKDVYAKLGSNRKNCIIHALDAPGINTTNPEVAVTENFLCTGGRFHHRDHIACTGDSGGAVFKNYEQRTIQIGVVSWGTKNLCTASGMVESDETSRDFHINLFRVVPFLKSVLGNNTQDVYAPLTFLNE